MRNSSHILSFLLLISPCFALSQSHCPLGPQPAADIQALSEQLNKSSLASETYFESACRKLESDDILTQNKKREGLRNKPTTDWLRTTIPFVDKQGLKTQDFFEKVIARVKARQEFTKKIGTQISKCSAGAGSSSAFANCGAINAWLKEELPQIVQLARFNLALAHSSPKSSRLSRESELKINTDLDEKKSFKSIPWDKMGPEEKKTAQKAFSEIEKNVKAEEILKVRHMHYMIYLSFMGINPILQYIHSENPSMAEIKQASSEILKNLDKEQKAMSEIEKSLAHPFSVGRSGIKTFDDKILNLLDYRTEVEEVLMENPEYCGLGLALHQVKANKQLEMFATGLPVLAVSFFVPPAYGLAIGVAGSAVSIYQSQSQLDANITRENARIQREGTSELMETISASGKSTDQIREDLQKDVTRVYRKNLQSLKESQVDRNMTVVMGPAVMVSPVALKYGAAYTKSMIKAFMPKR